MPRAHGHLCHTGPSQPLPKLRSENGTGEETSLERERALLVLSPHSTDTAVTAVTAAEGPSAPQDTALASGHCKVLTEGFCSQCHLRVSVHSTNTPRYAVGNSGDAAEPCACTHRQNNSLQTAGRALALEAPRWAEPGLAQPAAHGCTGTKQHCRDVNPDSHSLITRMTHMSSWARAADGPGKGRYTAAWKMKMYEGSVWTWNGQ